MKNLKRAVAGISAVCLLSLLSSCLKNNDSYYNAPVAQVSVFQASSVQPPLDVYFNNNRVNWNPVTYGTGLDYLNAYAGVRTISFFNQNSANKLFSDTITLKAGTIYSLFLANSGANTELVRVVDTINKPDANKANIRFINLSPDAPAVDFAIKDSAAFVSNKLYKGRSSFAGIAGGKTYNFEVRQKSTTTVLASLPNIPLTASSVYTFILSGTVAGTGTDKLTIWVVNDAHFID